MEAVTTAIDQREVMTPRRQHCARDSAARAASAAATASEIAEDATMESSAVSVIAHAHASAYRRRCARLVSAAPPPAAPRARRMSYWRLHFKPRANRNPQARSISPISPR